MSYCMIFCFPDRLNFGDNFTGIYIDRERCLRPFPLIETRKNGILGVKPSTTVTCTADRFALSVGVVLFIVKEAVNYTCSPERVVMCKRQKPFSLASCVNSR